MVGPPTAGAYGVSDSGGWQRPGSGGPPQAPLPGSDPTAGPPGPPPGRPPGPPAGWDQPGAGGWDQPGAGGQWEPADTAPKPGTIPLRPLGVGELLDGSLQAIRRNPKPMLALPAVVGAVYGLATGALLSRTAPTLLNPFRSGSIGLTDAQSGRLALDGLGLAPVVVLFGLATLAVTAVLTVVVARSALGDRTTARQAWRLARGRVLPLIGLGLVLGVAASIALAVGIAVLVALGFAVVASTSGGAQVVLLVVVVLLGLAAVVLFALVYVGRLGLTPVVLVLDGWFPGSTGRPIGLFAAIARTWRLTRGHLWRTLGILLLVQLIASVAAQLIQVPLGLIGIPLGASGTAARVGMPILTALTSVVGLVISLPFTAAGTTLTYLDLRMRREGLDLELALGADAARRRPG